MWRLKSICRHFRSKQEQNATQTFGQWRLLPSRQLQLVTYRLLSFAGTPIASRSQIQRSAPRHSLARITRNKRLLKINNSLSKRYFLQSSPNLGARSKQIFRSWLTTLAGNTGVSNGNRRNLPQFRIHFENRSNCLARVFYPEEPENKRAFGLTHTDFEFASLHATSRRAKFVCRFELPKRPRPTRGLLQSRDRLAPVRYIDRRSI